MKQVTISVGMAIILFGVFFGAAFAPFMVVEKFASVVGAAPTARVVASMLASAASCLVVLLALRFAADELK